MEQPVTEPIRRVLTICLSAGLLLLIADRAEAQARLALLIANESYDPKLRVLKRPKTDVALVETSLRKLGFQVERIDDAGFVDIHRAITRHTTRVRALGDNALSFIYYAGHGVSHPQLKANYLIPTDVTEWDDRHSFRGHVCFQIDDFMPLFTKAKALGILDTGPWGKTRMLPDGAMQMFLRDPSGNLLEISCKPGTFVEASVFADAQVEPEKSIYRSGRNDPRGKRRAAEGELTSINSSE